MSRSRRSDVAFVLSGGASLGAVQAGMLRALYEHGIAPDLIVGTSAGALNGAFIAARPPTVETTGELSKIWTSLTRGQVFPVNPLTGLLGFLGARDHLVPQSGLRQLIARHVGARTLEELAVPLHVVTADVLTGEEVRLSRGPLIDAVLASTAIPGVLPPVAWDGRVLMDGGVANNTPISHAIDLGAQRIYVLPVGHACTLRQAPGSALSMALHAISLLTQQRLIGDVERHRGDAQLIVLPPPCPLDVQPNDFAHAAELIARAYRDARAFLRACGEDRPPLRMRMHRHAPARTGRGAQVRTERREKPRDHARR